MSEVTPMPSDAARQIVELCEHDPLERLADEVENSELASRMGAAR